MYWDHHQFLVGFVLLFLLSICLSFFDLRLLLTPLVILSNPISLMYRCKESRQSSVLTNICRHNGMTYYKHPTLYSSKLTWVFNDTHQYFFYIMVTIFGWRKPGNREKTQTCLELDKLSYQCSVKYTLHGLLTALVNISGDCISRCKSVNRRPTKTSSCRNDIRIFYVVQILKYYCSKLSVMSKYKPSETI